MIDEQHDAFLRGFNLAQPPGPDDADALEVAEEIAPAPSETVRVAVSKDTGKKFLAVVDSLPEHLAGAAWLGFVRGLVAQAARRCTFTKLGGPDQWARDTFSGMASTPRLSDGDSRRSELAK